MSGPEDLASLMMPTDYVTLRLPLVDAVGFDAAVVLERIRWRCEVRPEGWVATYSDIAADTRLSRNRVHAAATVLRERGWLTSENAGEGSRTLRWLVVLTPIVPNQDDAPSSQKPPPIVLKQDAGTTYRENRKQDQFALISDDETAPVVDLVGEEFAAFWSSYPLKKGKAAAEKAFRRVRRTTSVEVIRAGFVAQLPALRQAEPRFVPHAATWLNGERWSDELPANPDVPGEDPTAWMRRRPAR